MINGMNWRPASRSPSCCSIGLPGMSGIEVAERLRREPRLEKALLIAVTGFGQQEDQRRTRQAGFDAHLVKPVEPDAIFALLARGRS